MNRIRALLKRPHAGKNVTRLRRRRNAATFVYTNLSKITSVSLFLSLGLLTTAFRTALLAAGYIWMSLIPIPLLSQGTYIDENALQPSQVFTFSHISFPLLPVDKSVQVNTYWTWQDVHRADLYLHSLEVLRDQNSTSEQ